jgi:hypothetical protein
MYANTTNTDELLADDKAMYKIPPFPYTQPQMKYYHVDISCDTDINPHWNDYDWISGADISRSNG